MFQMNLFSVLELNYAKCCSTKSTVSARVLLLTSRVLFSTLVRKHTVYEELCFLVERRQSSLLFVCSKKIVGSQLFSETRALNSQHFCLSFVQIGSALNVFPLTGTIFCILRYFKRRQSIDDQSFLVSL